MYKLISLFSRFFSPPSVQLLRAKYSGISIEIRCRNDAEGAWGWGMKPTASQLQTTGELETRRSQGMRGCPLVSGNPESMQIIAHTGRELVLKVLYCPLDRHRALAENSPIGKFLRP